MIWSSSVDWQKVAEAVEKADKISRHG